MPISSPALPSPLDRLGVALSGLCLVHCLALPVLISLMPALSFWLPTTSWMHPVLIAVALPVTGTALWAGYRRHGQPAPPLLGAMGLLLLILGALAATQALDSGLTVTGGLAIALAHLRNWRALHGAHDHAPVR